MSEVLLKKHLCIPCLATTVTPGTSGGDPTYTWTRIDKSTVFSLNPNPQTEDKDYICYEMPVTVVDHYAPELPQEIEMDEGNPMYDFIFKKFHSLPVGNECVVPCLICFPTASSTASSRIAWLIKECTIVMGEMNTVDKKISFSLKLGGNITHGYYTLTSGVPTFSETAPT